MRKLIAIAFALVAVGAVAEVRYWLPRAQNLRKISYTTKDYVQDGLMAMWDGIENAGVGVHDASAETWKDLVGSNDLSFQGGHTFNDTYLTLGKQQYVNQNITMSPVYRVPRPFTIEIVIRKFSDESWLFNFGYFNYGESYCGWVNANKKNFHVCGTANNGVTIDAFNINEIHTLTGSSNGKGVTSYYFDGEFFHNGDYTKTNVSPTPQLVINSAYGYGQDRTLDIFAFRIYYDTTLTDAQIRHNYNIDKERFGL